MAKKRRKSSTARPAARTQIIRTPAPIVRVSAPRAAPVKHRRSRRRSSVGRSVGGFVSQHNIDMAVTGGIVGLAVKSGFLNKLPAIPVVGRIGTAAIALDYYSKHGGGDMARRAASGFAFLAGYQLGTQGSIDGMDDDEYVEPGQVSDSDEA